MLRGLVCVFPDVCNCCTSFTKQFLISFSFLSFSHFLQFSSLSLLYVCNDVCKESMRGWSSAELLYVCMYVCWYWSMWTSISIMYMLAGDMKDLDIPYFISISIYSNLSSLFVSFFCFSFISPLPFIHLLSSTCTLFSFISFCYFLHHPFLLHLLSLPPPMPVHLTSTNHF